jgi:hypothetical protein
MGVSTGIFLMALGAILTYGITADVPWVEIDIVGWVLMAAGAATLLLTIWFWRDRRGRNVRTAVENTRLTHQSGPVPPDAPDAELRQPPMPPEPPNLPPPAPTPPR